MTEKTKYRKGFMLIPEESWGHARIVEMEPS